MKQTASKSLPQSPVISAEMTSLLAKTDTAEKAALKALADFEKKQSAYKEALQNEPAKNVLRQIRSAVKIAKLTCKIKREEYKLAKSEYRFARKAAKKDGQKAGREAVVATVGTSGPKARKAKA